MLCRIKFVKYYLNYLVGVIFFVIWVLFFNMRFFFIMYLKIWLLFEFDNLFLIIFIVLRLIFSYILCLMFSVKFCLVGDFL